MTPHIAVRRRSISGAALRNKKLDKKLRQAVDQIGGTVVIVWGGKAYRIQ